MSDRGLKSMPQTTSRRAPHSKMPLMSLEGETHADAGRDGYLSKSDCATTGCCFARLRGILGHPVITVILPPPIVRRVPAAAVFRDPDGWTHLPAKFSGEQIGLFPGRLQGHLTSTIAMLAQFGSAKLYALNVIDAAFQGPRQ